MSGNDFLDAAYVVEDQVVAERVGDELILLDLQSERYLSVDSVGSRMWTLLQEGRTPRELRAQLVTEYDVDDATLEHDVAQFTNRAVELGLLRRIAS